MNKPLLPNKLQKTLSFNTRANFVPFAARNVRGNYISMSGLPEREVNKTSPNLPLSLPPGPITEITQTQKITSTLDTTPDFKQKTIPSTISIKSIAAHESVKGILEIATQNIKPVKFELTAEMKKKKTTSQVNWNKKSCSNGSLWENIFCVLSTGTQFDDGVEPTLGFYSHYDPEYLPESPLILK